jgi:hypothetical protein
MSVFGHFGVAGICIVVAVSGSAVFAQQTNLPAPKSNPLRIDPPSPMLRLEPPVPSPSAPVMPRSPMVNERQGGSELEDSNKTFPGEGRERLR